MKAIRQWWSSTADTFTKIFGFTEQRFTNGEAVLMTSGAILGAVLLLAVFNLSILLQS